MRLDAIEDDVDGHPHGDVEQHVVRSCRLCGDPIDGGGESRGGVRRDLFADVLGRVVAGLGEIVDHEGVDHVQFGRQGLAGHVFSKDGDVDCARIDDRCNATA